MTQKDKADVIIYLKELITEYIETDTYVPLIVIASEVRKKFPKLYPKKNCPSAGTISRYLHDIGYKPDKSTQTYIPLEFVQLDDVKIEHFDNPFLTIIKTSERNILELQETIMNDFKNDIIHIQSDITDDYGVLIIYSTKYNLGACLQKNLETYAKEYEAQTKSLD